MGMPQSFGVFTEIAEYHLTYLCECLSISLEILELTK
jgi:hypothetical protein